METSEITIEGRKYKAYVSPDHQSGAFVIVGPAEGLVDELKLPEPFATRLHNALYERGIINAKDASRKPKDVTGALQEALSVDAQMLVEMYHKFEKEQF